MDSCLVVMRDIMLLVVSCPLLLRAGVPWWFPGGVSNSINAWHVAWPWV